MEIKKITKTDKAGKRLFVELGKEIKSGGTYIPELKKGDEVLVMPMRKITDQQMHSLLGKYVKFFEAAYEDGDIWYFEGIIKLNKPEYWEDEDKENREYKYALIEGETATIAFDNLNGFFDLEVIVGKEKLVNKTQCWNKKCKKQYFEAYDYCPHCGKKKRF